MDMVRKGFGNKPLKNLTMERKRVEKFEEFLNEDGDESILFFSRISLSKFSLEALFLSWVKGVFILRWEWNMKSQVFQNRAGSRLDWVASSNHEVTERPVVPFCLVVLQLACRFNFWHAWHVCSFWWLAAASHLRDPVASPYFSCTLLNNCSHYLTHYSYKNLT